MRQQILEQSHENALVCVRKALLYQEKGDLKHSTDFLERAIALLERGLGYES